jgi:hypothetical protein
VRLILQQTLQDWELIITDNGCSALSGVIVAGSTIRVFALSARRTRRPSRCGATRRSGCGEFTARMDADDICFPD